MVGTGDQSALDMFQAKGHSLPAYHRRVTEDRAAVIMVPIGDVVATDRLVDAWLSCCLLGSPSLLCFFVDASGVCRGCRFVAVAEIPLLSHIAQAYSSDRRCLAAGAVTQQGTPDAVQDAELGVRAFDPRALRERSHALLEMLLDRCNHDGGHCLVVPGPRGLDFLDASGRVGEEEDEEGETAVSELALALRVDLGELLVTPADAAAGGIATTPLMGEAASVAGVPEPEESQAVRLRDRLRRAHVTQALLMYHAAVRLAQPRLPASAGHGEVKGVPIGSRWTAKSCRHPLRVRQMMLHAVRAIRAAAAAGREPAGVVSGGPPSTDGSSTPPLHRRFLLLLASACEFLADSFLAEDSLGDDALDVSRYLTALRHLRQSCKYLAEYLASPVGGGDNEDFAQSVRRLEERVLAKRTNAHLCLARLRQRQPWRDAEPGFRAIGQALQELDAAEELVAQPPRSAQPHRPPGPQESSLLASISKWKADLLHELASLAMPGAVPGAEVEPRLREYLEAQQRETQEQPQPLPAQCERWLLSTISLSLRGLHQLGALPSEVTEDLQLQARERLARAYGDLGHIYASTGRYTKAMTHAKQGIELFVATKDKLQATKLQLWLCRLQLRMAVPQAAPAVPSAAGVLEEPALLRGLSAASGTQDAACAQVVQALQRVLKSLEIHDAAEQAVQCEGQRLLGRVLLRQGLTRLAHSAPFCAVCRLCEDDSVLPGILELLQAAEVTSLDGAKEAVELLLQAKACFRDTGDHHLGGIVHSCLAAVYYYCRQDARVQRLALTHCQHALEHLGDANASEPGGSEPHGEHAGEQEAAAAPAADCDLAPLILAMQVLQAKVLRRGGPKGGPSHSQDARAMVLLCDVALQCCQRPPTEVEARSGGVAKDVHGALEPGSPGGGGGPSESEEGLQGGPGGRTDKEEAEELVRTVVLASDEQKLSLMTYLKQELSDVLLKLLRGNERQDGPGRELKSLYCSLLTAWHSDTGQAQALTAVRMHAQSIVTADT